MAEYAWAVLEGRPHFHISIVMDVSPFCDCHPENDAPIVSDVGMFASFDPVALDQACADAVNKMPALVAGSILGERDRCHRRTRRGTFCWRVWRNVWNRTAAR